MLGIFLSYCIASPVIAKYQGRPRQAEPPLHHRQADAACYMNGSVPQVALEYGRKTISAYERPSIDAVEQEMMNPGWRRRKQGGLIR